ncbi:MAG: HlyD family efflux transporter periplasmic adaptor subunit [Kofleriaceae bacterium]
MIKWLAAIVVVAGAATGGYLYLRGDGDDGGASVPTYTVAQGTLVRQVSADGNLRAVKATPLLVPKTSGDWGGMKIAWLVPDGSRVKKGDVVVKFDRTEPEKKLADGKADLESADARLAAERIKSRAAVDARDGAASLAGEELEQRRKFQAKDKEIFSRNQIVESEIDETLAGAKQSHAEKTKAIERNLSRSKAGLIAVEQQKAKLAIQHATTALESMEIHAPHDGIFVLTRNWRGDVPKLGDQLWPGQPVGEIPLLDEMEVEVFVLEVDGNGLAEKQQAEIMIEARPETIYKGKVRLVDKLAKPRIDAVPIQYFAVVVQLDKTDAATMKPGQRVHAKVLLDSGPAAVTLVVPRQAILNKDGKNFVWKRGDHGDFETVGVELGAATSGRVVVTSGLSAGDVIALRDPTRSVDQTLGSGTGPAVPASGGGGGGRAIVIEE